MEKKTVSFYHLFVTALFVGILLSFAIFYLIHATVGHERATEERCLDGTQITGESFVAHFERAVYQNANSLERIREHQFLLFQALSAPNVIVGSENFLFAIEDRENGYNFLEDYLGEVAFTEEECADILAALQTRVASYDERGAQYLLVVIPNAQTVHSEHMPAYMGALGDTRLSRLEEYLAQNGFDDFLNLTDALIANKDDQPLYDNTENSLNSLGVYYAYLAVCEHLENGIMSAVSPIPRDTLTFYQHLTTGKAIARQAGVSDIVSNLTISLSNRTPQHYLTTHQTKSVTQTTLHEGDLPLGMEDTPTILLQFSNRWERLQAEPFFSNSFKCVTYQTSLIDDRETFLLAHPSLVVQFIYENELSRLLP